MSNKSYSNFVKASSPYGPPVKHLETIIQNSGELLSGEEARKIYLEEVKHAKATSSKKRPCVLENIKVVRQLEPEQIPLTNKALFTIVQNNDVDTLKCILDRYPDKINVVDDFGWSLLMIACQANSTDAVKLLLSRGIDISVRDKAGNSARSLVIQNKDYVLADILLGYKQKETPKKINQEMRVRSREKFMCEICIKTFPDREEHLSSTLHNISASRGKKVLASYVLPESNRGYQLMLKGGWDKHSGLGKDGSGKLYPIKTVQKKDKKGLGHPNQKSIDKSQDNIKRKNRMNLARDHHSDKLFEIKYRREFY